MVRLMIRSSKEHDIDLNAEDSDGFTAFHSACFLEEYKICKVILENYEEFGIDIKKQDKLGRTSLDILKEDFDFFKYFHMQKMRLRLTNMH